MFEEKREALMAIEAAVLPLMLKAKALGSSVPVRPPATISNLFVIAIETGTSKPARIIAHHDSTHPANTNCTTAPITQTKTILEISCRAVAL
jgi:hypothetical protein